MTNSVHPDLLLAGGQVATPIRVLHITDLHLCADPTEDAPTIARIQAMLPELKDSVPDLVVVTGDVTFSAQPSQFDMATKLLQGMSQELRGTPDLTEWIAAVPGNHDQNREILGGEIDATVGDTEGPDHDGIALRNRQGRIILKKRVGSADRFVRLAARHPFFAEEAEARARLWNDRSLWEETVNPRFEAFSEWLRRVAPHCHHLDSRAGGVLHFSKQVSDRTIHVLGLNSAIGSHGWLEACDEGTVFLSEPQVADAMAHLSSHNIQDQDIVLALMHHPWDALAYNDRYDEHVGIRLRRGCHFMLTGHAHRIQFLGGEPHSGLAPTFAARALSKGDGSQDHGFSLVSISGNVVTVSPRRKAATYGYISDRGIEDEAHEFEFTLPVGRLAGVAPRLGISGLHKSATQEPLRSTGTPDAGSRLAEELESIAEMLDSPSSSARLARLLARVRDTVAGDAVQELEVLRSQVTSGSTTRAQIVKLADALRSS